MLNLAHMIKLALRALLYLVLIGCLPLQLFAQFQGQEFVPNKGQWPQDVLFLAKDGPNKIWMGQDRLLFQMTDFSALEAAHHRHEMVQNPKIPSTFFAQIFEQTNTETQNYLVHSSPKYLSNRIPMYIQRVACPNLIVINFLLGKIAPNMPVKSDLMKQCNTKIYMQALTCFSRFKRARINTVF